MNTALPAEVVSFASSAAGAFAGLGSVDCARACEQELDRRTSSVGPLLESLGVGDIDPRADLGTALAAAVLAREAGRVVLPYPVVGRVLAVGGVPLALGPGPIEHGDLFPSWVLRSVSGSGVVAQPSGAVLGSRLGTFVVPSTAGAAVEPAPFDALLHLTLTAWWILGVVERAVELAVEYVNGRVQFGQTIASFQAVQFQLADAAVAVDGLREMAAFTIWRLFATDPAAARPDALALRLCALDTARAVIRTCQQLHGAAGVCDEYDISLLCRHVQPALRLPFGAEQTAREMASAVAVSGFDSLFVHGGL